MNNIVPHTTNNLKHTGVVSCKLFKTTWPTFGTNQSITIKSTTKINCIFYILTLLYFFYINF